MNTIIVPWRRLEHAVFTDHEGDIAAAYSSDIMPKVRVFLHEGRLWTSTGGGGSGLTPAHADCHQIIPEDEYTGTRDKVPHSHEGERVTFKGGAFRLGPKVRFIAAERTVAEWRVHLRAMYQLGGMFTAGKTYHGTLRDHAEHTVWNTDTRDFEPLRGNVVEAIRLELKTPDFTKHGKGQEPRTEVKPQLELALA
jgi:hypothetical protein